MKRHGSCLMVSVNCIAIVLFVVISGYPSSKGSTKKIRNDRSHRLNTNKQNELKKSSALQSYRIRKGDTLTSIAGKYNVSLKQLIRLNEFSENYKVKADEVIKVPLVRKRGPVIAHKQSEDQSRPSFIWPVKKMINYKPDGSEGVKPIGLIIQGAKNSIVCSAAHGTVERIGRMRGFGRYVVIKHESRYVTVYSNVSGITVSQGDELRAGEMIGRIQNSNPNIHFQIDLAGKPENPLKYLPKNM